MTGNDDVNGMSIPRESGVKSKRSILTEIGKLELRTLGLQ